MKVKVKVDGMKVAGKKVNKGDVIDLPGGAASRHMAAGHVEAVELKKAAAVEASRAEAKK